MQNFANTMLFSSSNVGFDCDFSLFRYCPSPEPVIANWVKLESQLANDENIDSDDDERFGFIFGSGNFSSWKSDISLFEEINVMCKLAKEITTCWRIDQFDVCESEFPTNENAIQVLKV